MKSTESGLDKEIEEEVGPLINDTATVSHAPNGYAFVEYEETKFHIAELFKKKTSQAVQKALIKQKAKIKHLEDKIESLEYDLKEEK